MSSEHPDLAHDTEAIRAELRDPATAPRAALDAWQVAAIERVEAAHLERRLTLDGATAADLVRAGAIFLLASQRLRLAEQAMDREWLIWAAGIAGEP